MNRRARTDANQQEIVRALRAVGCSVQSLATVGRGCPDLLVGVRGRNLAVEVKDGRKPPSARRLTDDEKTWHALWRGQVAVVSSVDEAIALVRPIISGGARFPDERLPSSRIISGSAAERPRRA